jgi:RNA methyltransferase, TrmH family
LKKANLVVACDHIGDPGNLGTVLRACDWFGVDAVILSRGCVSLYNEKVIRSTVGSIFHMKVIEEIDFYSQIPIMKENGFRIIATTLNGKPFNSFQYPSKTVLIFGSEAHGISPELIKLADEELSIPNFGRAESLNVGIACGVFLSQWRNRSADK